MGQASSINKQVGIQPSECSHSPCLRITQAILPDELRICRMGRRDMNSGQGERRADSLSPSLLMEINHGYKHEMEPTYYSSSIRARPDTQSVLELSQLLTRQSDCRRDAMRRARYRAWPAQHIPRMVSTRPQVQKGSKAIELCMPLTRKVTDQSTGESAMVATNFVWKPRWFVLAQTEGEPVEPITTPAWSKELALAALGITEQPFTHTDGNVQGYAKGREVSISPLAAMPHKTLFHELAHIELGHTAESDFTDSDSTPRSLREAEGVAMLLCESLQLPGSEFSRGYIQNWLKGDTIPERSSAEDFRRSRPHS